MTQNDHMPTNDFDDLARRIDADNPQPERSTEEPEILYEFDEPLFDIPEEPDYEAMDAAKWERIGDWLADVREWEGQR